MTTRAPKKDAEAADGGAAELQEFVDDAEAKGYIGFVPDPNPNKAYSLQSGPDSPAAVTDNASRVEIPAADQTEIKES